ncbi:DUF4373 domain-containing protein [Pseudomonadales bacterium]|nr:DUF4373 domain-containing protein [Pseudomonadales bacterium]MDB4450850.1 DUF4373 domain-containing protein [Pseudomonadales bacterium]
MKWFRHDSNAHNDAKLQKILMRYGAPGYALYWYCLELIAGELDSQNYTFELEHDAELLAHHLKIDELLVEKIMTDMVGLGLFESSSGKIYCLKMLNRLDDHTARNPEIRKIIDENKANALKTLRSDYEDTQTINKVTTKSLGPDYIRLEDKEYAQISENELFDCFWNVYPRKKDKAKAKKAFEKINPTQALHEKILADIQTRMNFGEWEKTEFIPYATTYLNGERWNDEQDFVRSNDEENQVCL